jgi:hypothetical protein
MGSQMQRDEGHGPVQSSKFTIAPQPSKVLIKFSIPDTDFASSCRRMDIDTQAPSIIFAGYERQFLSDQANTPISQ